MSSLKERLSETIKSSMKAGDKTTLAFGRTFHAAIRKKEIDDRVDLDDAGIQKIAASLIKQRQDSIAQFKQGGREDLVQAEEAELKFLQGYLPEQLSEDKIRALVLESVAESGAKDAKDMGKVMKVLMPKLGGRADGKLVSQLVQQALAGKT